jgi:cbb3-type cytochrome oxidase subunit 3
MDVNTLRIAITLATMVAFLGIVFWAYRPSRKQQLDQQGRSILEDGDDDSGATWAP